MTLHALVYAIIMSVKWRMDYRSIHHSYYAYTTNLFLVQLSNKSQTESILRAKELMKA